MPGQHGLEEGLGVAPPPFPRCPLGCIAVGIDHPRARADSRYGGGGTAACHRSIIENLLELHLARGAPKTEFAKRHN